VPGPRAGRRPVAVPRPASRGFAGSLGGTHRADPLGSVRRCPSSDWTRCPRKVRRILPVVQCSSRRGAPQPRRTDPRRASGSEAETRPSRKPWVNAGDGVDGVATARTRRPCPSPVRRQYPLAPCDAGDGVAPSNAGDGVAPFPSAGDGIAPSNAGDGVAPTCSLGFPTVLARRLRGSAAPRLGGSAARRLRGSAAPRLPYGETPRHDCRSGNTLTATPPAARTRVGRNCPAARRGSRSRRCR